MKCPKCGTNAQGKRTCCASDGAWSDECGKPGENKYHTWLEGVKACQNDFTQSEFMRVNNSDSPVIPAFVVNVEENINANGYNEVSCMSVLIATSILIDSVMYIFS